ncbi:MBL fold metallo-hydrolase [Cytobacillus sp. FSL W7-1323]|uniref:Metallo-beta-lactamase domain-containing protein n=1 Tax=Cytobacillus kochii TaxID=859143 RepID=A0A248TNI6_9BACI|nr:MULTISPECIES: MBL fold metallo-hydrolase [Cytobacillus]ASV69783.1 hypothetical protein CKF48_22230 [Cytobacillus kochii]MDQ0184573.1 glyoxylase-like metal-dependent hydrolase (beta-lactamase superfamily II) [Cytobacillus kochii]MEA1852209.1 MBL fold metallo-hydrolase [Cytobacillus sp. OWB-43]MED1606738.1 MBL fold metallo-hydrolase [Cytobacillus kochii]
MKSDISVLRIPIPTPTLWPYTTTNSYIIGNKEETLIIDTGYNQPITRETLHTALKKHELPIPKAILLTHGHKDHSPGVKQLLDWQIPIFAHPLEEPEIRRNVQIDHLHYLSDHEEISIGDESLIALHLPGHSSGHLSFYLPSKKILLAGDNLIEKGTSWIGTPDGNMKDYFITLEKIKSLSLTMVGPGHGDWINNPYEHIDYVLNRRIQREEQILQILKENEPLLLHEITNKIYAGHIHPSNKVVAEKTTEAHLIKLIEERKVIQNRNAYSSYS